MTVRTMCPYCGAEAKKVTGKEVYPHRPDLYSKTFYMCAPCNAYVGCHPGTCKALGRLANAELRAAKSAAHRMFDPIWRDGDMSRSEAYRWLAGQLGIDKKDCHIGMFDVDMCEEVERVCQVRINSWFNYGAQK